MCTILLKYYARVWIIIYTCIKTAVVNYIYLRTTTTGVFAAVAGYALATPASFFLINIIFNLIVTVVRYVK